MGRKVKIRPNYADDALYLRRLGEAIQLDPKQKPEFKQRATAMIQELLIMFTTESYSV